MNHGGVISFETHPEIYKNIDLIVKNSHCVTENRRSTETNLPFTKQTTLQRFTTLPNSEGTHFVSNNDN